MPESSDLGTQTQKPADATPCSSRKVACFGEPQGVQT